MTTKALTDDEQVEISREILTIIQKRLGILTLPPIHDDLDFHELSVWQLKAALNEAYMAGFKHGVSNGIRNLWETSRTGEPS